MISTVRSCDPPVLPSHSGARCYERVSVDKGLAVQPYGLRAVEAGSGLPVLSHRKPHQGLNGRHVGPCDDGHPQTITACTMPQPRAKQGPGVEARAWPVAARHCRW